jgi:hypothetical protein
MDKTLLKNLTKIELGAWLLIVLSTLLLNYFEVNPSGMFSFDFCKLWVVGILIDICSFLIVSFCIIRHSKSMIAIPIIGWVIYFFSCLLCRKSLFLASREVTFIQILMLKTIEFLILSLLHFCLQFLFPTLIRKKFEQ